jgi:hypothetical protein
MNSKQRRKEYRRLIRKNGTVYYTMKIDDDCIGIFEHTECWQPRFRYHGNKAKRSYRVDLISKSEYDTFTAFEFPVIEKTSLFGPIDIILPPMKY